MEFETMLSQKDRQCDIKNNAPVEKTENSNLRRSKVVFKKAGNAFYCIPLVLLIAIEVKGHGHFSSIFPVKFSNSS